MGSLTSRPKVPEITAVPQVVYTPQTTSAAPINTTTNTTNNAAENTRVENNAATESAARVENLLRQNRGLSGTILTGFRGLLSASEKAPQRKTLLGE